MINTYRLSSKRFIAMIWSLSGCSWYNLCFNLSQWVARWSICNSQIWKKFDSNFQIYYYITRFFPFNCCGIFGHLAWISKRSCNEYTSPGPTCPNIWGNFFLSRLKFLLSQCTHVIPIPWNTIADNFLFDKKSYRIEWYCR